MAVDRPRPLAEQIAIQAQEAGLDHHLVISAVTGGEKSSAAAVTKEEGQVVLQAIAAIRRGDVALVQVGDAWELSITPDVR